MTLLCDYPQRYKLLWCKRNDPRFEPAGMPGPSSNGIVRTNIQLTLHTFHMSEYTVCPE